MISRWHELRPEAVKLRKKGFSIGSIEKKLGIPRSTLSGWLKDIVLTQSQIKKLYEDRKRTLAKAQKKASLWHIKQKNIRIEKAEVSAKKILNSININDNNILELAIAILYLGEGTKKCDETSMASSDPTILKLFLSGLIKIYKIDVKKIRCELNLRHDQNAEKMKTYWSEQLDLPVSSFKHIRFDKRTIGSKTFSGYNGVCYVRYGSVAIQRKIICLGQIFCNKIIKKGS